MMRCTPGWMLIGLSIALAACSTSVAPEDPGDPDPADAGDPPTSIDAGSTTPGEPDAAPSADPAYPPGPYGTTIGAIAPNTKFQGYIDSDADADSDPFNEPPREISFADFYTGNDPAARLLFIDQSAGWCGPCREEASLLPAVAAEWQHRGIRFLTALVQTESGDPGTIEFARSWGQEFVLTTPVVADPDDLAGAPFGAPAYPFYILIDTKDMKVVSFPQEWLHELGPTFEMYAD